MPGPIVDEIVAVFHSLPLQPVGRFFSMVLARAIRFSVSLSSSKLTCEGGKARARRNHARERGGSSPLHQGELCGSSLQAACAVTQRG